MSLLVWVPECRWEWTPALYSVQSIFPRQAAESSRVTHLFCGWTLWTNFVDITGRHPKTRKGNSYIFTIIDHWTKYAFAFPARNHTAPTLYKILVNKVYSTFGFLNSTLCDIATEHNSSLMRELEHLGETEGLMYIPYRPQSNAVCEHFHLTLNRLIIKAVDDAHRNWNEFLPHLMRAYNTTVHDSTGYTPHFLIFGQRCINGKNQTPPRLAILSREALVSGAGCLMGSCLIGI